MTAPASQIKQRHRDAAREYLDAIERSEKSGVRILEVLDNLDGSPHPIAEAFARFERDHLSNTPAQVVSHDHSGEAVAVIRELKQYSNEWACGMIDRLVTALQAHAPVDQAALREAIENAATWHDEQAKALSKQPQSGDVGWRRMEHREQAETLRAALSPATPTIEENTK